MKSGSSPFRCTWLDHIEGLIGQIQVVAIQPACVQLDRVVWAHFVAAVAADAFVESDVLLLDDDDSAHRADAMWRHTYMKAL